MLEGFGFSKFKDILNYVNQYNILNTFPFNL